MRLILQLLFLCVIAVGVGLGLTAFAVQYPPAFNVIQDGPWAATANEGGPEVDAYALAALAHRGEAPLALSDGLTFRAHEDEDGNALSGACTYEIAGAIPTVRLWSLAAFDKQGRLMANDAHRYGFSSADVRRNSEGEVRILLSPEVQSGDWLPTAANAEVVLVLRLYDTTAGAISGGRSAPELPAIRRIGCGA